MSRFGFDSLVLDLCDENDFLIEQLHKARADSKEWRDKYNDLLNSSINHSQVMMRNMIDVLLDPPLSSPSPVHKNRFKSVD